MKKNKFITLLLAALINFANAQTTELPINLQAESGEYDANAGVATYTGNVVITQGEMNVKGDKVVIKMVNNSVNSIEAWGKPATFHYVPQPRNKKQEPPIDGRSSYMKYSVPNSTVFMQGNAFVIQDKNETKGNTITYDLKKEKVKGTKVNMTLIPQKK